MTEEIEDLVAKKHASEGTPHEKHATLLCSERILATRMAYIETTKRELRSMKKGSKLWWKKASYIMGKKAKDCNIPALKDDTGEWVMDPTEMANLIQSSTLQHRTENQVPITHPLTIITQHQHCQVFYLSNIV